MSALNSHTAHTLPAASLTPARPASGWRPRHIDRYSRRVTLLKRVLPVIGVALLVLVAIWPRLVPLLESVRFGIPVIDLREAHELRMLNPRYAGVDRYNRPYVVTSAIGRQASNRDDLMSLERPRAEMTMHNGALVVVTAATAMYQSQAQLLDLFGDVNLVHENGTRFVTNTAHVDVAADSAVGNDPVTGHGPSGDITAQGFRVLDKGDTIVFTGKSNLLLKGTKPSRPPGCHSPNPSRRHSRDSGGARSGRRGARAYCARGYCARNARYRQSGCRPGTQDGSGKARSRPPVPQPGQARH